MSPDRNGSRPLGSARLGRWAGSALAFALLVTWLATTSCRGHKLAAEYVPNHPGKAFNFKRPPCDPAPLPGFDDDRVAVRYFGVGGLYIAWNGAAIVTAPYFSNHGEYATAFQDVHQDMDAIHEGMSGLPDLPVAAVLAGHSHHDHLGDLPPIVEEYFPETEIWLNRSGMNMLRNCRELERARMIDIEPLDGTWRQPQSPDGTPLPFRVLVIKSNHAEHFLNITLAKGEVAEPWDDCLSDRKMRNMNGGTTYAFLIDLLDDEGRTAFRIHYQDAASDAPHGIPRVDVLRERPIDLAVVCMPDAWEVEGYPGHLLSTADVRHVLVTHYEDFFRPRSKSIRFVALLTSGRAADFMEDVSKEMSDPARSTRGPENDICGPSGPAWTMPLPGEWMIFGPG